jgi:6-phosphogluconolactonase
MSPSSPRPSSLAPLASLVALAALAACADAPTAPASAVTATPSPRRAAASDVGGVYTLTNGAAGNAVLAFRRAADGSLSPLGSYPTGGLGTGGAIDPLVSQYAVVLSDDASALFAVDAGSDEVSSFRVASDGALSYVGTVASGGDLPVSLAVHGNLLYVLDAGDATLHGFRVTGGARLVALPGTARALPTGADGAAAVRFTPDGRHLIVSERLSNRLDAFPVLPNGRLGEAVVTPSSGRAAFGFDVTPAGQAIVTETQGTLSSYAFGAGGGLQVVTASTPVSGAAPCWVIVTGDGRFAYTANAGTSSISGFRIGGGGQLTPVGALPTASAGTGAAPLDLDQVGSRFLYVLEAGTGTIGRFAIGADGGLTAGADTPAGPPASGLQGLAAF